MYVEAGAGARPTTPSMPVPKLAAEKATEKNLVLAGKLRFFQAVAESTHTAARAAGASSSARKRERRFLMRTG
ncbi:MAG: hypothetical protein M0D55_09645 [Elusimicrobiota bacterium]|nr:MAG: hypothetical protein M0D55_09645 [Elusimicrobiota bacterium]